MVCFFFAPKSSSTIQVKNSVGEVKTDWVRIRKPGRFSSTLSWVEYTPQKRTERSVELVIIIPYPTTLSR